MTSFEPDGVYAGIPYRVLPDVLIEAMMPGGVVKFKNINQLMAAANGGPVFGNGSHSASRHDVLGDLVERNASVPASANPLDYYSILVETIKKTEQNSAQLRALVYERARFNVKRDILFGYSSTRLVDIVRHINEFELAVARIEANSVDDDRSQPDQNQAGLLRAAHSSTSNALDERPSPRDGEQIARLDVAHSSSSSAVQILPARPDPSEYSGFHPIRRLEEFQRDRRSEEVVLYARAPNLFIGILLVAMLFIATAVIAGIFSRPSRVSPALEVANNSPNASVAPIKHSSRDGDAGTIDDSPKLLFPLPTSYGVYALNNNQLIELESLPINIPDPRVALSAELKKPSTTTLSDSKPTFILFRRDFLNNAPQKITLRVVAHMMRETKFIDGKANVTKIDRAWRIRNISYELKVSPIAGQREMIIARADDNLSLAAGRYALVMDRIGYDFTIKGPVTSAAQCLERFETANGNMFSECQVR